MKKFALLLIAACTMTLVLDSCSVQKRYHRKGFTVNWNNVSFKMKKNQKTVDSESIQEDIVVSDSKKTEKFTRKYQAPASNDLATAEKTTFPSIPSQVNTSLKNKINKHGTTNFIASKEDLNEQKAKSTKKEAKAIINAIKKDQKKQGSNTDVALLLLLALFLPFIGAPLAVYLYEGYWTERCTINLILTLLCGLPGIIHAFIVILGNR